MTTARNRLSDNGATDAEMRYMINEVLISASEPMMAKDIRTEIKSRYGRDVKSHRVSNMILMMNCINGRRVKNDRTKEYWI